MRKNACCSPTTGRGLATAAASQPIARGVLEIESYVCVVCVMDESRCGRQFVPRLSEAGRRLGLACLASLRIGPHAKAVCEACTEQSGILYSHVRSDGRHVLSRFSRE
jgi:hypothetical protein